ncbi:hypothetical protein BV22DRAFT_1108555 [Leucogyrophana mollusca]|uniref:Uncharacterized protein n=1 Tax=Leucogyrophana mollusca TaxID=85980 RepID=A0ACB8AW73_9AGAM|nr:hypothetical protein BV22DRAFT_1108555 [Leucogyrophana mollusca]
MRTSQKLSGYGIPGLKEKQLINMFADDTTIYLRESDNYQDLESILETWCKASGAKFNLEKTEIIPIGSPKHRKEVTETRKLNQNSPPIEQSVRIAKDGHPIQSLGAWIGNNMEKGNPTIYGKSLIVQMTIGGMTQFLMKAQGMPESITKTLTKMIRTFIWGESKSPPIRLDHLHKPINEGGINLLDIPTRNQAINITWLKAHIIPTQL